MALISFNSVYSTFQGKLPLEESPANSLLIEIGKHHIAISLVDLSDMKLLEVELINIKEQISASLLQEYVQSRELNSSSYHSVTLVFNINEFALIPSGKYTHEFNKELLELMHGDLLDLDFNADKSDHFNLVNVFGVQREIHVILENIFPEANRMHQFNGYLNAVAQQSDRLPQEFMRLYFSPSHMDILIIKDGKLQFLQKYYIETSDDVIYHLLTVVEEFELKKDKIITHVGGLIEVDSIMFLEIKKHFPQVALLNPPKSCLDEKFSSIPAHFLTPLISSLQCV
jgi:hypothetical protein